MREESKSADKASLDLLEDERTETRDDESHQRTGAVQVEIICLHIKESVSDQGRVDLDNKRDTHEALERKECYSNNSDPEQSTEGGSGPAHCEENRYFVEIPSDGEHGIEDRAIVPYNLAIAMRYFSRKRKAATEEGVSRKRVKYENGHKIFREVVRIEKGKSCTSRSVQKRQRNRRMRPSAQSRSTKPLFDVVIMDIVEFKSGCGV